MPCVVESLVMPDFGDRRVMACTPGDLKRWLGEFCAIPGLAGSAPGDALGARSAAAAGAGAGAMGVPQAPVGAMTIDTGNFSITLRWKVLEPRRIALIRIEQLELEFAYPPEASETAREWIMRFDRHTQRGGG